MITKEDPFKAIHRINLDVNCHLTIKKPSQDKTIYNSVSFNFLLFHGVRLLPHDKYPRMPGQVRLFLETLVLLNSKIQNVV